MYINTDIMIAEIDEALDKIRKKELEEKDKQISKLMGILDKIEEMLENPYNVDCINQNNYFLQRIKELKEGK